MARQNSQPMYRGTERRLENRSSRRTSRQQLKSFNLEDYEDDNALLLSEQQDQPASTGDDEQSAA